MTNVTEDTSTPAVTQRGPNTSGTATSNSFTPPGSSYVLVLLNWKWLDTTGGVITVKDNHGNTFTSIQEVVLNGSNGASSLGAFGFYYYTSPGSTTITATCTKTALAAVQLAPRVLLGASDDQSDSARAFAASYNVNIKPTSVGSSIYCASATLRNATPGNRSDMTSFASWTNNIQHSSGTKQYRLSSSATYYGSDATGGNANGRRTDVGGSMYQGGETDSGGSFNGTMKSMGVIGGTPDSDLSGLGIDSINIRLTNLHSWYGSGLQVYLGYNNRTSLPSSWNASDIHTVDNWHQDSLATLTHDLTGMGLGTAMANGTAQAITIGPGSGSFNLNNYGWFYGSGGDNSQNPLITVNWSLDTWINSAMARRTAVTSGTTSIVVGWNDTADVMLAVEIQPKSVLDVSGTAPSVSTASGSLTALGALSGTSVAVSVATGSMPGTFPVAGLSVTSSWAGSAGFAKVLFVDSRTNVIVNAYGGLKPPIQYLYPVAGSPELVTAQLLNNNLVAIAPIPFVTLTAQLYYNAVGSWSMVVPYSNDLWAKAMAGEFIVEINWRGLFTFGGKCEQPGYSDSMPGARGGGSSTGQDGPFMVFSGADYLALIANKIAYPNPSVAWSSQLATSADTVTNIPCETAVKHYVNLNLGAGALASRKMSLLDIAPDLGRGSNTSYTVKFAPDLSINLMDVIRTIINSSAGPTGMGLSIKRNGKRLLFDTYIPRDLTGKAWFSEALGNLTSVNFSLTDPTCTDALARGASLFVAKTAVAKTQWNSTEQYLDQSSETDANNLNAYAQNALLTGGAGPVLDATTTDSPFLTFGRDYGIGDLVTIEVVPGASYSDVVSGVTLTVDPSQTPSMSVVPKIGHSGDATSTDQSIINQLSARIRLLEKRLRM